MLTRQETRQLLNLSAADLVSAYNGKAGKCACGCSGRHSYMDAEAGSARRGYAVDPEEVRPKSVALTLEMVQENFRTAESFGTGFSAVVGERVYAVYPKVVA